MGLFKRKKKGLAVFQDNQYGLRARYANTPIPPINSSNENDMKTVPGERFASQCTHCRAYNIHMVRQDRKGLITLICVKCKNVYEVEKI